MPDFDIIIKGGTVFDGLRNPRYSGDLGIKDGVIAAIGRLRATDAKRVVDASGMHVAPGFVDLHTHYDSQIFWDPYCSISGWHGVTTVAIGNCGFGFAPVAPELRQRIMLSMTHNEAVPMGCMEQGMPWDWVSFGEFLDSLDRTDKSVNLLTALPLTPVLIWAMGLERAKAGDMPTDAEHATMRRILNEAMDAGASGWTAQWRPDRGQTGQTDYDGTPMPTDLMHAETAVMLAQVLADRNEGYMQFGGIGEQIVEEIAEMGRPIILQQLQTAAGTPEIHREALAWLRGCWDRGLPIYPQGITTRSGLLFRVLDEFGSGTFDTSDTWRNAIISGTVDEKLARLRDPAVRAAMKIDQPSYFKMAPLGDVTLLRGESEESVRFQEMKIRDIARALGKDEIDTFWDINVADRLETLFYSDLMNNDRKLQRELIDCEWVLPGQSDGGAHTKYMTAGRYPTEYLTECVRDLAWMSAEEAHWRLSAYPAFVAGARGRGILQVGAPADVVVYDFANLEVLPEEVAYDYPAGEWRRIQRARGYQNVLVNGRVTIEEDKETSESSGQLLRHGVGRSHATRHA